MPRICFILLAAFLSPRFACAQANAGSIVPPLLGFVFENRAAALRPVWGIPGAATLGDRLDFGYAISNAVAASQQGFALTVSARDQAIRLVPLQNSSVAPVVFSDAVPAPDLMVLSPAGRTAALYRQTTQQLQVVTGLPATPVVTSWVVPAAVSNSVADLAVTDDGGAVLLSTPASVGFALWLVTSNDSTGTLLASSGTVAFAFRPNSHDAVAAGENGDLLLLQNADAQLAARHIQAPSSRITGVQLSADGKRIYVGLASGVAAFDLDSQVWTNTSCSCSPRGLIPFGSVNFFRLTDPSRGPIFLLDISDAKQTRIWFIPQDRDLATPQRNAHE